MQGHGHAYPVHSQWPAWQAATPLTIGWAQLPCLNHPLDRWPSQRSAHPCVPCLGRAQAIDASVEQLATGAVRALGGLWSGLTNHVLKVATRTWGRRAVSTGSAFVGGSRTLAAPLRR